MAHEADAAAPVEAIDPRQGTLLGFERPADVPVAMPGEQLAVEIEPAAPAPAARGARAKPAAAGKLDLIQKTDAGRELDLTEKPAVAAAEQAEQAEQAAGLGLEMPVAAKKGGGSEKGVAAGTVVGAQRAAGAKPAIASGKAAGTEKSVVAEQPAAIQSADSDEPKLLSPGEALASARQQAARRRTDTARASAALDATQPAALAEPARAIPATPFPPPVFAPSDADTADAGPRALAGAQPPGMAQTVASLQEALAQERSAAQERWRRTRHWLTLASAGLVLLFVLSVAQTVALIGFTHRTQAAQQQTQLALNHQQAALAGLASSTSALAARLESAALTAPAPDGPVDSNASKRRPARHAKLAHARHAAKEKTKPAAH
jgi:hypothetical protein